MRGLIKLMDRIRSIGYEGEVNDVCLSDDVVILCTNGLYYGDMPIILDSIKPEPFSHRSIEL